MKIKLIENYADLKLKIAELTEKMRDLEPQVLLELIKSDNQYVELETGRVSVVHRKSWTYSDKVEKLATKLKEQKAIEEIKGIASYSESESLMFKQN